MKYYGIRTLGKDPYIWWITNGEHESWMAFLHHPNREGQGNAYRLPLAEAIKAYKLLGYECVEVSVCEVQQLTAKDAEIEEESQLRERLSDILSRTAIALKGPNEELSLHSWHDLPEKATELQQQLAEREKQIARLLSALCEIAGSKSLTATPTQFYQHLQRIASDATMTQDLSDGILCDADKNYEMSELTPDGIKSFTVYRAKEKS
jgi:hypothetical protein